MPEGDGSKGNNPCDSNKSDDTTSHKSHNMKLDWREFRANLFAQEKVIQIFSTALFFMSI